MGTDIHMIAERFDGERWCLVGERRYREFGPYQMEVMPEPYDGRNYDLFAILANVRNGMGFAGVDTGDGYIPIAEPRGCPPDASPEYAEWLNWCGGHSASWLLVSELVACDWNRKSTKRGCITLEQFAAWDGESAPRDGWCGWAGGRNTTIVGVDQARMILAGKLPRPTPTVYVQVSWEWTYGYACHEFVTKALPKLLAMGHPDKVRICFFFDS